ncbi:MAG: hypothetical protein AB1896_11970 [Thermodesulfobacteriota bacterium]
MFERDRQLPENIKLGRAKALEVVILGGAVRVPKKFKVRFWIERRGARIDYYIVYNEKVYHMTYIEFRRRFKILDKAEEIKIKDDFPEEQEATS